MEPLSLPLAKYCFLMTRPMKEGCALYRGLGNAGAKVFSWPMIETEPVMFALPESGKRYQGIFFSSQNAVLAFLGEEGARQWTESQVEAVFAVGSETAELLKSYLSCQIRVPNTYDALSAVKQWQSEGLWKEQNAILWPCGSLANPDLLNWAKRHRVGLEPLETYRTRKASLSAERQASLQADAEQADCWVFTSPSAVEAFISYVEPSACRARVACLGARTKEACRQLIGRCDIASEVNTMAGLCHQIIEYYTAQSPEFH